MTSFPSRRELLALGASATACSVEGTSAVRTSDRPSPDLPSVVDAPGDGRSLPCGLDEKFQPSLPVASVPTSGGVLDPALNVVIARDARGLYAFSAVCPHEGCVVRITRGASTICPCHDSTFDDDGAWTGGPARRPLLNHPVRVCEGRAWVDPSLGVPIGTRTPL